MLGCDSEENLTTAGVMTGGVMTGGVSSTGGVMTGGVSSTGGVSTTGGVMTGGVTMNGGAVSPPGGMTGGGYVPPMDDAGRCFQSCLSLFACDSDPAATCGTEARAALAASCQVGCAGAQAGAINSAAMQGCGGGSGVVGATGLVCVDESLCVDVSCEPGQGCDGGVCSPWACQPDFYDDSANDTRESSYTLEFAPLVSPGLSLCAGDEDWFRIELPAGSSLRVDLAFKHAEADIDAKLFIGEDTTSVKSSASGTDNERLVLVPADESRTVLLQVYVYGNNNVEEGVALKSGRYGLYISTDLPAEVCQNGIDCATGKLCNTAGVCVDPPPCASDEDCAGGTCLVDTGECVQCLVDEDCFSGICDPSSYSCVECLDDSTCAESGEVCDVTGSNRCVECVNDGHCPDGTCNESNRCIPNSCTDMYEPNEDQASASALGAGGLMGAYICGDEDWYSLTLDGQPTLLTIEFTDEAGDIEAELIDSTGTTVMSRRSSTDNENFGLIGRSGPHYLRVFGAGFVVNSYNVSVTTNPPIQLCGTNEDCPSTPCDIHNATCQPEGYCNNNTQCLEGDPNTYCSSEANICQPCQPDPAEPNNSLEGAVSIERALGQELNVCGARDFFKFEASPGQTIRATVLFTHESGDVDMKLYGPSETGEPTVVESSLGTMDNESVEYTVERAGVHYLEVYGFGTDNLNTYRVEFSL